MERLIIADAHVGQRRGDTADMVSMVLKARDLGVTEIIYLGDAFRYLLGMRKFWTAAVEEVVEAWRAVRADGVRIGVIEGNRDFFLDHGDLAAEIDWSGLGVDFTAGRLRYRLVHGDKVNLRDFQYRFWSSVSKSRAARMWARLLPQPFAVAIVRSMEARLAETNRRFRYHKPLESLRRAARSAWSEGIDIVMWGHFHTPWEYRSDRRIAMILPAWLETGHSVAIDAAGRWALVDRRLTACDGIPRIS